MELVETWHESGYSVFDIRIESLYYAFISPMEIPIIFSDSSSKGRSSS